MESQPQQRFDSSYQNVNGWKTDFVNEVLGNANDEIENSLNHRKETATAIWKERKQRQAPAPAVPQVNVGGVNIFEGVEVQHENSEDAPPLDSQGRQTDWVPNDKFNVLASAMADRWKKNMKVTRERQKGYVASQSTDPYINKQAKRSSKNIIGANAIKKARSA
jgi:hypothetical protein